MRKKRLLIGLALIFSAQALTFVAWPSSVSGTSILGDEHPKSKREALRNYRREHELARKLPVT